MSAMGDLDAFCTTVGEIVEEKYGYEDGDDLCFTLIEQGVIDPIKQTEEEAARIVAQHMEQQ